MAQIPVDVRRKSKKTAAHPTNPTPTPQSLLVALRGQYGTRFHMFLIVATSISVAVLTTRLMFSTGITEMWVRYAVALLLAYGTFFMGVWVWLHLSQYGRHLRADWGSRNDWSRDPGLDIVPNIILGGGGGSANSAVMPFQDGGGVFDGGGAGGSWDVPDTSLTLGSPLARGAQALDSANWAAVLLKKTWKPFALMAGAAMIFALFCNEAFPQATTAGQVIQMMLK